MSCPNCFKNDAVKNGRVRGLQRFRCRACGFNYTQKHKRGFPPYLKLHTLIYYRLGLTMNVASDITPGVAGSVSVQTVSRWLKEAKAKNPWFLQALAEHRAFLERMMPTEEALAEVASIYVQIVGKPNP